MPASGAVRLPSVGALTRAESLARVFGPVTRLEWGDWTSLGLSGARHRRLTVHLESGESRQVMLKLGRPGENWTARRSGDAGGREVLLLAEPALAGVWEIVANPYLAYARDAAGCDDVDQTGVVAAGETDEFGVLMEDLGPWLVPASAGGVSIEQEDVFLWTLARLHARFWESNALRLSWLAAPTIRFSILGPQAPGEELARTPDHPLFRAVERGWEVALARLPEAARERLLRPAEEIAAEYAHLPRTLLHGDAKIGNCAFLPEGRVALFDWATMGVGPATLDLGYYLAVDSARQVGSKDAIVAGYRRHLQEALQAVLAEDLWEELLSVAVIGGARMLLWSKALALETDSAEAKAEWSWWVDRL